MAHGTLGGRVKSAARVSEPLAALKTTRPRQAGGGREYATVVVAASDSHASAQATADYVCDGSHDEDEITLAIDDVGALGGGRVILLEGTFSIHFGVGVNQPSIVVQGQGPGTRLVKSAAVFNPAFVVPGSAARDCTIRDLTIDGGTDPTQLSVAVNAINGPQGLTIENVHVTNGGDARFSIDGATGSDCIVRGCSGPGAAAYLVDGVIIEDNVFDDRGIEGDGTRAVIANNTIRYRTLGIYWASDTPAVIVDNTVLDWWGTTTNPGIWADGPALIVGNHVQWARNGIDVWADATVIAANRIEQSQRAGIRVFASDALVVDNLVVDSSVEADAGYNAIEVQSGSRASLQSNIVRQTTGQHVDSAIYTAATAAVVNCNDLHGAWLTAAITDVGTGTITAAGNQS
jgi:hypothetical protein